MCPAERDSSIRFSECSNRRTYFDGVHKYLAARGPTDGYAILCEYLHSSSFNGSSSSYKHHQITPSLRQVTSRYQISRTWYSSTRYFTIKTSVIQEGQAAIHMAKRKSGAVLLKRMWSIQSLLRSPAWIIIPVSYDGRSPYTVPVE